MRRCFPAMVFLSLAAAFLGWVNSHYVRIEGQLVPADVSVLRLSAPIRHPEGLARLTHLRWLDLRGWGMTPEEYAKLAAVTDSRIVWELAFQGGRIPAGSEEITLDHLSQEEAEALDSLPRLRTVEAAGCHDYPQLLALQARHPECRVHYTVELGGTVCDCEDNAIAPGTCTLADACTGLDLLPLVQTVDLQAAGLSQEESMILADRYPGIRFLWEAQLGEARFLTDAKEIDLSGIPMEDSQEVEALLPYLWAAEKIVMCDCGIASPEMDALNRRYPDIRFVWRVKLGPLSARTDDTWFAPITHHQLIGGHDADELKYCTDMECIDLGHCWIRDCEWAKEMPNLRYLVLADSYVTDLTPLSGLKNLAYLELFVTPVKDYSPLLGCTGLEDLNLGYSYGDPEPISQMHWLKNLWWGGIHYVPASRGRDPAALLRSSLPDTRIMLYAGSSTGLGWRTLPHYYEMRDRIGMYYMTG